MSFKKHLVEARKRKKPYSPRMPLRIRYPRGATPEQKTADARYWSRYNVNSQAANTKIEEAILPPKDPPMMLLLRRQAIRNFPGSRRVALYSNPNLKISLAIPYDLNTGMLSPSNNIKEEDLDEAASRNDKYRSYRDFTTWNRHAKGLGYDVQPSASVDGSHNGYTAWKHERLGGSKVKGYWHNDLLGGHLRYKYRPVMGEAFSGKDFEPMVNEENIQIGHEDGPVSDVDEKQDTKDRETLRDAPAKTGDGAGGPVIVVGGIKSMKEENIMNEKVHKVQVVFHHPKYNTVQQMTTYLKAKNSKTAEKHAAKTLQKSGYLVHSSTALKEEAFKFTPYKIYNTTALQHVHYNGKRIGSVHADAPGSVNPKWYATGRNGMRYIIAHSTKHKAAHFLKSKILKEDHEVDEQFTTDELREFMTGTYADLVACPEPSELEAAIFNWLTDEIEEFGDFDSMPEDNLRDNFDDYMGLMSGAADSVQEDVNTPDDDSNARKNNMNFPPKVASTNNPIPTDPKGPEAARKNGMNFPRARITTGPVDDPTRQHRQQFHEAILEGRHAQRIFTDYADWHDASNRHGESTHKIHNAGNSTSAFRNGKHIGTFHHDKKQGFLKEESLVESPLQRIMNLHKRGEEGLVRFHNGAEHKVHPKVGKVLNGLLTRLTAANRHRIGIMINKSPAALQKVHAFAKDQLGKMAA